MSNFQLYSEYYNLFYQDKNYAEEVDYIEKFIKEYSINPQSILDLGCGSGRHDYEFFKKGYQVTGVDLSQSMLELTKDLPGNNIEFFHGDVRTIDLKKKFDVVISLFHILSYQQTNDDVIAFFETVKKHLKPEGIFICDCWYGPGVLNDPPVIRIKEFETNYKSILRI
ncbi:MAG TPA: class I SAM-dependent methyltransferase, partial [Exilispira sp.]|nr:class I SAM-dependent methyltransferase [Exilispira sp.]